MRAWLLTAVVLSAEALSPATGTGQQHDHSHHHGEEAETAAEIQRPKVFLDKSPRIVAYQLQRLENARLLLVERSTDDAKYIPVYSAILSRAGMSPQFREEAVSALAELKQAAPASVLLEALADIKAETREDRQTARQLATMLLRVPQDELADRLDEIKETTAADLPMLRSIGYAALLVAGQSELAWEQAGGSDAATLDWLAGIRRVPDAQTRNPLRSRIVSLINDSSSTPVKRAAIETLSSITKDQSDTFGLVAPLVADAAYRDASVRTLLKVPAKQRDDENAARIVEALVGIAESTPPAERTSASFVDAMQLADQLLARLPIETSKAYRERLDRVTVRLVRIRTVEEEMRYDIPYFAVEAGRPVADRAAKRGPDASQPRGDRSRRAAGGGSTRARRGPQRRLGKASNTCPNRSRCCSPRTWSSHTNRMC